MDIIKQAYTKVYDTHTEFGVCRIGQPNESTNELTFGVAQRVIGIGSCEQSWGRSSLTTPLKIVRQVAPVANTPFEVAPGFWW